MHTNEATITTEPGHISIPLAAECLSAGYGPVSVIQDVSIAVRPAAMNVLLGANGAGKTTTIRALCGLIPPQNGTVLWRGAATRAPLHVRAREGLAYVAESRSVFSSLSLADNLKLAAVSAEDAFALFPELKQRFRTGVGNLSGGEQQMLALALALGRSPAVLLADELSLGLAPLVVERLLEALVQATNNGLAVLLVEQHVRQALGCADYVSVLRRGQVAASGTGAEMRGRVHEIEELYLQATA
jgi:branched-chain amino acid transport system ATP-binding protein